MYRIEHHAKSPSESPAVAACYRCSLHASAPCIKHDPPANHSRPRKARSAVQHAAQIAPEGHVRRARPPPTGTHLQARVGAWAGPSFSLCSSPFSHSPIPFSLLPLRAPPLSAPSLTSSKRKPGRPDVGAHRPPLPGRRRRALPAACGGRAPVHARRPPWLTTNLSARGERPRRADCARAARSSSSSTLHSSCPEWFLLERAP